MTGPLEGVRIFDLTRILAGPSCTQILADLGAEVIKIERPGVGDDTRRFAPPFILDADDNDTTESAYYLAANRNKQSITLDLTQKAGQDIARKLIAKSDVLVENFKTGGLSKYGLGYDDLKNDFPHLVYCSITGFGHTGPYATRPGYDLLLQGMSGLMSCTGDPKGEPMKSAVPVADLMAGMYAAVGINAALRHKEIANEGQHIDIGMLDVMVAFSSVMGMNYLATGKLPERMGNAHPNIVPYQAFETADGNIILAVGNDGQYQRFCNFAGVPELGTDPRYAKNSGRLAHRDELVAKIRAVIKEKPSNYWLEGLQKEGVSCGPINNLQQVFEDPQVIARGLITEVEHPLTKGRPVSLLRSPLRLSKTPVKEPTAPPVIGSHTDSVLTDLLGFGRDEIDNLREADVI